MAGDDLVLQESGWEELRKEARKIEGDLDVKLSSYAKLGARFSQGGLTPILSLSIYLHTYMYVLWIYLYIYTLFLYIYSISDLDVQVTFPNSHYQTLKMNLIVVTIWI